MEQAGRSFEPVQLGSIELFCKAAELGGFTAAAAAAGVTPAAVSRSVARLETRLGVRLFERSTRSIRLTHDGVHYFEQCREALAQLAEAERSLSGRHHVAAGLLRVSVGTVYAHHRLLPLLPSFSAEHPDIRLDLEVSNRNIDLIDDGFDLAIRLDDPRDARVVAHKLEDASVGVFAAPAYLERHGVPSTPTDLGAHRLLPFVRPSTGRAMPWLFRREDGRPMSLDLHQDPPRGCHRVHDDALASVAWAAAGGGLVQTYHFVARSPAYRDALREVLQPYAGRSRPFHLLHTPNRHLSARVRAFVGFLKRAVRSLD